MSASEQTRKEAESAQDEDEDQRDAQPADGVHEVPLFLRDGSDGRKGNAQDEKDEMGE
jgi:hypothetical protein